MKKYIVRVRRDEQRIERIERIRVGAKDLPRIARNTRNLLLRETPTDGTDWYRWLGCAEMNNGLNRLNGFYSSGGILPPPRPSYIRAIRGRNILDVRGRPQNTLNTRKTIAERWTNTNYANKANNSSPTDGGWTQMLGCAGIEQRIKPIERVPAAWDFQQRIEPIERIL